MHKYILPFYINLFIGIEISRSFVLSICVLFISVIQLVHGAQFWNIVWLLFPSSFFAASVSPAPIVVMFF